MRIIGNLLWLIFGGLISTGNIIWILLFGWELAVYHVAALLFTITIIGIPFGTRIRPA